MADGFEGIVEVSEFKGGVWVKTKNDDWGGNLDWAHISIADAKVLRDRLTKLISDIENQK